MYSRTVIRWAVCAVIALLISACGGGGGSSDSPQPPNPPPPASGSAELNWAAPVARSNGDALAESERGDYLILYFREDELDSSQPLWSSIDSLATFRAGGSEIAYFVRPEQLGDIIQNSGSNTVQIASTATSYTFDALTAGTYYFSIAARDSDGQFAYLSNTVSTTVR